MVNSLKVLLGAGDTTTDGEAVAGELLAGEADGLGGLLALLDVIGIFGDDHLDVAWLGHVSAHTTVGTVGATATLGGAVDGDVLDGHVLGVELLEPNTKSRFWWKKNLNFEAKK